MFRGSQVRWNLCRLGDVPLRTMDDKTLALWRQIEGARRAGKPQPSEPATPAKAPEREAAAN
jgi:hypothetical protein